MASESFSSSVTLKSEVMPPSWDELLEVAYDSLRVVEEKKDEVGSEVAGRIADAVAVGDGSGVCWRGGN